MMENEKETAKNEELKNEATQEEVKTDNEETANAEEQQAAPTTEELLAEAQARIAELEKDRLYKQAEFDNYRKNVMKDKADLILNGGKKVLESMLPVVDDFELALQHMSGDGDVAALREGVELILKKLLQTLKSHGVEAIDTKDKDFDTDFHEAIAQFPAPTEELKGKVVDCTKKGYTMNGKVLRFAQVVVGV
ncbi:MAG: nucleotide exchange factor GrpE [Bacteroidaceae bacterium]|nr:nucleotide exchange factor GrpE [Bacteroidaceae bacterium]